MSFLTYSELRWSVEALQEWVPGARVQRIRRRNEHCLIFQCHRPGQAFDLILSIRKSVSRICVSTNKTATQPASDTISTWLKATLRGHRISTLTCDSTQRLVRMSWPNGQLVVEFFGKQPRILALDTEGVVRCIEPSAVRDHIRLGVVYETPEFNQSVHESASAAVRFTDLGDLETQAVSKGEHIDRENNAQRKRGLLQRGRKQLERLKAKLERDGQNLGKPEEWQQMGELLKTQAWRLERGMSEIDVVNYFDPDMPTLTIPLMPELGGTENIQRYFKKYRRSQSGRVHVERRVKDVDHRLAQFAELSADTLTLDAIEDALRTLKIKTVQTQAQKKAKVSAARQPYFEFLSVKGERILVGRGGSDNHQTSFRVGKGNDHWFHVKDAPGAHVLVPVQRGKEPHPETIKDALALALHYSKLREESDALVSHTLRKHVRPVVGGKAGLVTVQSEKVKSVEALDKRINRLFEHRVTH